MPTGAWHAAAAAVLGPQHCEVAPLPGPHEPWPAPAVGSLADAWGHRHRRYYTALGDDGDKADKADKAGDGGGGKDSKDLNGKVLLYTSQSGRRVEVSGESLTKCKQSCSDAAELKDENQSGVNEVMSMATGGERAAVTDCERFCHEEFDIFCFPGDSSVVVRDRGSVRVEDLQLGDAVLALGCPGNDGGGRWELLFDTVISWLHHEPDAEGEVLQIRHDAGQVQLTANHLIFARKPGRATATPCMAREVQPGDRLLAPWIDGSIAEPVVLSIDRTRKRGLYAPLVGCGTVFVDGTAASCYALTRNLQDSRLLRRVSRLADGRGLHAAAHAVFLPLRLLHAARAAPGGVAPCAKALGLPGSVAEAKEEEQKRVKASAPRREEAPIHPYAWVLYVLAASFLT